MPRLGAHMSVAGGLPRAVERAVAHRCEALQIFAKNANQWRGRVLPKEEIREFRSRIRASGIAPVVSHASYLINLASTNAALRQQSLDAMGDEIDRAEALGLLGVVLHPGCYTLGSEAEGLTLIAEGLLALLKARRRGKTTTSPFSAPGPAACARRAITPITCTRRAGSARRSTCRCHRARPRRTRMPAGSRSASRRHLSVSTCRPGA